LQRKLVLRLSPVWVLFAVVPEKFLLRLPKRLPKQYQGPMWHQQLSSSRRGGDKNAEQPRADVPMHNNDVHWTEGESDDIIREAVVAVHEKKGSSVEKTNQVLARLGVPVATSTPAIGASPGHGGGAGHGATAPDIAALRRVAHVLLGVSVGAVSVAGLGQADCAAAAAVLLHHTCAPRDWASDRSCVQAAACAPSPLAQPDVLGADLAVSAGGSAKALPHVEVQPPVKLEPRKPPPSDHACVDLESGMAVPTATMKSFVSEWPTVEQTTPTLTKKG
jgi:hypothetical protein